MLSVTMMTLLLTSLVTPVLPGMINLLKVVGLMTHLTFSQLVHVVLVEADLIMRELPC